MIHAIKLEVIEFQITNKIYFHNLVIGKEEYASRTAGLSIGYVLAVIVPVFMMVICFAFHWIQQHNLKVANVRQ